MIQSLSSNFKPQLLGIVCFFLLKACSQSPDINRPASQIYAPPPTHWEIKAKLGIRSEDDSGSVTLSWQQGNQRYKIQMQASLGQGNATIYGDNDSIMIERPGKPTLFSSDATELIKDTFGWPLPMSSLRYWILGIANPELPIQGQQHDSNGGLVNLEQSDWHLSYSRYQQIGQWQLPGKIRAKREETQLTLIIREWAI